MSTAEIRTFIVGYIETNMYFIHNNQQGIIIDPGFIESEFDSLIKKIRKDVLEVPMVILTHCHFDHITGCTILKKEFNCKIYCHKLDEDKLLDPQKSGASLFGTSSIQPRPDAYLEDGQEINFFDLNLKVLHTPGHTRGSISVLFQDIYLFSGDTIFKDGLGRTDLYDGDYDTEINSIRNRILTFPDDTIIYPGHGPATTVKEERKNFL